MKRFLTIIGATAVLVGLFAFTASAQQYTTLYSTNIVIGPTTNVALAKVITMTKYDQAAVQVVCDGAANSTGGNVVVTFQVSADGTAMSSGPGGMVIALNGTTDAVLLSNLNLYAAGYFSIASVSNGSTTGIASNAIKVVAKPQRYGR